MNSEISKGFIIEMKINTCLECIKECISIARGYIAGKYEVNDLDVLITTLSSVEEEILHIDDLTFEIEKSMKKLKKLKYE